MSRIQYHQPATLAEACSLLQDLGPDAAVLNGGSDLVVKLNQNIHKKHFVNIKFIPDLDYIRADGDGLSIGALTKLAAIAGHPLIRAKYPVLAQAVGEIGTPQVRNIGTLSGNLCNASPVADSAPALLVLGAKLRLISPAGERELALADFHTGPGATVLAAGELLREIHLPAPPPGFRAAFAKLGPRKAADIAVVNAAVSFLLSEGRIIQPIVCLGAVAPTLIRSPQAEQALAGQSLAALDPALIGALAAADSRPISDLRASREYRHDMAGVLVERALSALKEGQ